MTAQLPNRICLNGSYHSLLSAPEQKFWDSLGRRPPFVPKSTANWSGYMNHWAVWDHMLYLTDIVGAVCRRNAEAGASPTSWCRVGHEGACDVRATSLADLCEVPFGGIPADWYSGELRIPKGEVVDYVHAGLASEYERDRILEVINGKIVSQKIGRIRADPWKQPEPRWKQFFRIFKRLW